MPGYSTSEVLTEKRWIDGKPIYRTVVNLGNQTALANNTNTTSTVSFNTDKNVETTVMANVILGNNDETGMYYSTPSSELRYGANATQFFCNVSTSESSALSNVKVICEYTKTTDSASSKVATQNLVATQGAQALPGYSTTETLTEKRWIDGKPIYRKVITATPTKSDGSTVIIDANIKDSTTLLINSNIIVDESEGLYDKNVSSNSMGCFIGTASTGLYFGNSYAGNVGKTCYVWIEYTKSTDTSGSPVALVGGVTDTTISRFVGFSVLATGTTQSLPASASTYTKAIMNGSKDYDTNSAYDMTNSKYIIPVSGYYRVYGRIYTTTTAGGEMALALYKNGVSYSFLGDLVQASNMRAVYGSVEVYLAKGDYIELYAWSSSAITLSNGAFQASLIAPIYGGQNTLSDYSTTETLTERRWIDGKKKKRKISALPTLTYDGVWRDLPIPNPISGFETIVACKLQSNYGEMLPDINHTDVTYRRNWVVTPTYLSCGFGSAMSAYFNGGFIVYEYTKTTDTSASPVAYIAGGGSAKKYYARISNSSAFSTVRSTLINIPLNTLVKGDAQCSDGVNGFIAPQDDVYTIEGNYFANTGLDMNITEVAIYVYVNGVEEARFLNNLSVGGGNKSCNGSVSTRLAKGDKVTFKMWCWASDTTTALQIPVGSLVANIRN